MARNFINEATSEIYFSYFYGNFEPVSSISTFLSKKLIEAKLKVEYEVTKTYIAIDYPQSFFGLIKTKHGLYQDWILEWIENNNK